MADKSAIEWTDATWNPVTGCTEVSPGCDHCYAKTFAERWRGIPGHHFEQGFDVVLRPERLEQPLRWKRPRRIFANSMSDLFHDAIPDEYIAKVFAVMSRTPQHTYQILTKRHGRMRALLNSGLFWIMVNAERLRAAVPVLRGGGPVLLPNVWLGVSVEDQKWADIRIPALLETPAAVRFLSCEPLLGPVDLTVDETWFNGFADCECEKHPHGCPSLDWVIVGGESGPGARPMHPDWARQLRDQCEAAGVPFFFKQWGGWAPGDRNGWYSRSQWVEYPDGGPAEFMYAPKSKSLRELDGRTHDEYPEVPDA